MAGEEEHRQHVHPRLTDQRPEPITVSFGGSHVFPDPPNENVVEIHAGDMIEVEHDKDGKIVYFGLPRLSATGLDATRTENVKQ